jgi:hypothetical protein
MEETDQLWPLRCRDRLVELKDVASDGAQICGRNKFVTVHKKMKIDVVAVNHQNLQAWSIGHPLWVPKVWLKNIDP